MRLWREHPTTGELTPLRPIPPSPLVVPRLPALRLLYPPCPAPCEQSIPIPWHLISPKPTQLPLTLPLFLQLYCPSPEPSQVPFPIGPNQESPWVWYRGKVRHRGLRPLLLPFPAVPHFPYNPGYPLGIGLRPIIYGEIVDRFEA